MAVEIISKANQELGIKEFWLFDDGYYWFMHPWFIKLNKETGKYIDLYGDASFSAIELFRLEELITEVKEKLEEMPSRWNVSTGFQVHPTQKEIFKGVEKRKFLELLGTFEKIVKLSEEKKYEISFSGD